MLKDIIQHMTRDRVYEKHIPPLLSILHKILAHMHNFRYDFHKEIGFGSLYQHIHQAFLSATPH